MKKRIFAGLVALLMVLGLLPAQAASQPAIYRVTDDAGHTLYLFGTIHIGKESMYPLSSAVEQAYEISDALAVELDLYNFLNNPILALQMAALMYYTPPDNATKHLSEEVYKLGISKLASAGMPELVLKAIKIENWVSLAEEMAAASVGLTSDYGVDLHLLTRAHETGKPIYELETYEEQLTVLGSMSDAFMEWQLRQMLVYSSANALGSLMLCTAWQNGNTDAIRNLTEDMEGLPEEFKDDFDRYINNLLSERDERFTQQAIEYLLSGETVFFAVGAAHVCGSNGLAVRLAQAGYTVEEIGR